MFSLIREIKPDNLKKVLGITFKEQQLLNKQKN